MALPRTHNNFPSHHHHHHHQHHPPHHYRKKRGGNPASGSTTGGGYAGLQPGAAGPLRQLVDQEGGSSRDASEEDNDAFSEHSDSASSARHPHPLSSPTSSLQGFTHHHESLPTTARDRALVDSKPQHHGLTEHEGATIATGRTPLTAPVRKASTGLEGMERAEKTPMSSSPQLRPSAGPSIPSTSGHRKASNPSATRDPSVTAALMQASAALSSSSSIELSQYAADDEGRVTPNRLDAGPSSRRMERIDSIDSSSAGSAIGDRPTFKDKAFEAGLALPAPLDAGLGLNYPAQSSLATPVAVSSSGGFVSSNLRRNVHHNEDSDNNFEAGSEADSVHLPQRRSTAGPVGGASVSTAGIAQDAEVSDGGTASPYDGDVEFAARASVSQQTANANANAQASTSGPTSQTSAGTGARGTISGTVLSSDSPSSDADDLPASTKASARVNSQTSVARDVPCRKYAPVVHTATAHDTAQASRPMHISSQTEIDRAQGTPTPTSFGLASKKSGGASARSSLGPAVEPSPSDVREAVIALNDPIALSRLLSAAPASGPLPPLKMYVQATFDVHDLCSTTSLLRTAKLAFGGCSRAQDDGTPSGPTSTTMTREVMVIAGLSSSSSSSAASSQPVLALEQRAALARSCRWVDEVIEGVPFFPSLASDAAEGEDSLIAFLRDIEADVAGRLSVWTASGVDKGVGGELILELPRL